MFRFVVGFFVVALAVQIKLDPSTIRGTIEGLDELGRQVVVRFEPSDVTTIDRAWLGSAGPSPWTLDKPGTYRLSVDVETEGTAFAITSSDVVFDLGGHTVTYDNAEPVGVINGSFETGDGWKITAGATELGSYVHAEVATGERSLLLPTGDASSARGDRFQNRLVVGRSYVVGAQAANKGATNQAAKLVVRCQSGSAVWTGPQYRPMQYRLNEFIATDEAGEITIESNGGSEWRVDEAEVRTVHRHGIVVSPQSWAAAARYPDVQRFGTAANVTIRNGTVRQGQAEGFEGHAIHAMAVVGLTVEDATLEVSGPQSYCIDGLWSTDAMIRRVTAESDSQWLVSRDQGHGAVVRMDSAGNATVVDCSILGGCQNGIKAGLTGRIEGNTIRTRSRYTNGYAVWCVGAKDLTIRGNKIESNIGDYGSRGIFVAAGDGPVLIDGNDIGVREMPRNQEYGGCVAGGAYGIQIEDHKGKVTVSKNNVSTDDTGGCDSAAFRVNVLNPVDIVATDNVFKSMGENEARTLLIDMGNNDGLEFRDNELISNSRFFVMGHIKHLSIDDCTFRARYPMLKPFVGYYWPIKKENGAHVTVVRPRYRDVLARTMFDNEQFRQWSASNPFDPFSSLDVRK